MTQTLLLISASIIGLIAFLLGFVITYHVQGKVYGPIKYMISTSHDTRVRWYLTVYRTNRHIGQWASTLNINLGHSNNQQKKLVLFSGILFFIASILTLASASIGLAKNQHQLVGLIAGLMMFVGAQARLLTHRKRYW